MDKTWTVKEVRALTGLDRKQLYYFHHEGIVLPASFQNFTVNGRSGYKCYDEAGLAKLYQIAIYYDLGYKQNEIRDLMRSSDRDVQQAFADLEQKLTERRARLDQHLAALEQLRFIGIQNSMSGFFRQVSLHQWGQNQLTILDSQIDHWLEDHYGIAAVIALGEMLKEQLPKLIAMSPATLQSDECFACLAGIFDNAKSIMGIMGYFLTVGIFLSAVGRGEIHSELAEFLGIRLTVEHGNVAIAYLKKDLYGMLGEFAAILNRNLEITHMPYDSPEARALAEQIQSVLTAHTGIAHAEEYRAFLPVFSLDQVEDCETYLTYICVLLKKYYKIEK